MYLEGTAFIALTDSIIPDVHQYVDIVRLDFPPRYTEADVRKALNAGRAEGQPPLYVIDHGTVSTWVPFVKALHNNLVIEITTLEDYDLPSLGALANVSKIQTASLPGILSTRESSSLLSPSMDDDGTSPVRPSPSTELESDLDLAG